MWSTTLTRQPICKPRIYAHSVRVHAWGRQLTHRLKTNTYSSLQLKVSKHAGRGVHEVFFAAMVVLNEDRDLSWTGVKQTLSGWVGLACA